MQLTEAEIQVLASLARAAAKGAGRDRATLEKDAERFWMFREDWSGAYDSLTAKGLIAGGDTGYGLTEAGAPVGRAYHAERPDLYWYYYQRFYPAARASAAHSKLCERVFGADLTQEGMVDMAALGDLLRRLDLKPRERVLDLGCGAGAIAEYISDRTGTHVTGLDYSAPAIAEATARTAAKRDRLSFVTGDINALDLPERSFDALVSLDTLYWVADLGAALGGIARLVRPGGRIGAFMVTGLAEGATPGPDHAHETPLGRAAAELGLGFEAVDYTRANADFWRRIHAAAIALQPEFEAEGNGFIPASLIREARADFLPAIEAGTMARYLYMLRV